jgi:hypothetical protein
MSIDAMKQALEALVWEAEGWEDVPPITRDAITALRAALAEPEQEPVAWVDPSWMNPETRTWESESFAPGPINGWSPLYTAPPQRKPPQFPTMLRKMWSGAEVQKWINENWEQS